ncbi:MAG: ABC transporter permease [Brevinema sp.]
MKVLKFLKSIEGNLALFSMICFVILWLTSNFGQDVYSYFKDVSYLMVAGMALMLVILTGEIDISSGTVLGLIGFFTGNLLKMGVPIGFVICIAMLVGMINSLIVGVTVVKFRVPSIVASLAMIKLHIGIFPLLPNAGWVSNIPQSIINMGNIRVGVIPLLLVFSLIILIFFIWFMKYTTFGRNIYAVGGSDVSAKLAGINVPNTKLLAFMISGALLGISSIMFWLPSSQVQPSGTIGMEMTFITIAVVSGCSILGGTGRPIGIIFSTLLISMLQRACILWNLGNAWLYVSYGVIVLCAVYSSLRGHLYKTL